LKQNGKDMKTAFELLKKELELNNELFNLGFISHVEKICKDQHAKFLYETQKRDSQ
jgi:hypothetical protein